MYYLGIDQGGSSSRAFVCDAQGHVVTHHQVSVATLREQGHIEQNPAKLLQSIHECIAVCLSKLQPQQRLLLRQASLVCQRSSFVAINTRTNKTLSEVISWQDTRAQQQLDQLLLDPYWLRAQTGLCGSGHYGASKMAWLIKHHASVQQAAKRDELMFLPLGAFLASALTNSQDYRVDPANASRTLLMSIDAFQWHQTLLTTFGLKAHWLPRIVPTLHEFGDIYFPPTTLLTEITSAPTSAKLESINQEKTIKKPVKSATNAFSSHSNLLLGANDSPISLRYVNGDQSAALFAYGQPSEEDVFINMGTGAFVSRLMTVVPNEAGELLRSIVHHSDNQNYFVMEGPVNGCGVAIAQMAQQLNVCEEPLKHYEQQHASIPLFINAIGGLAAPYWRADIESRFIGEGNPEAKFLAVLESIVFLIATLVERLAFYPPVIRQLVVSGGLANHPMLCQSLADLTGFIVKVPNEVEASVLGSIWWLAGQPQRWLPDLSYQTYQPSENVPLTTRYQTWQVEMNKLLKT